MASEIVVRMSGDEKKLFDAFRRIVNQQDNVEQAIGKSGKQAKQSFGDNAVNGLVKYAAGFMSVSAAIQHATAALERQRDVARESKNFAVGMADAQAEALINLSAKTDEEQTKVIGRIKKMSAELKPQGGENTAWQIFSAAYSGTGGDTEKAMESAKTAMRIAPTNAEVMRSMAAVLPDVGQMTGATKGEEQLGYMLALGKQAVSTSQKQVSEYLVPAAKTVSSYGATPEESGAIVTSIQKAMGQRDVEGRLTGSAVANLASQLEKALPEVDRFEYDAEGKKKLKAKGTGLKTITERIAFLQKDAKAREKFIAGASFEAPSEVAVQELLGAREGRTAKYYQENLAGFTKREEWGTLGNEMIRRTQLPREQRLAGMERGQASTVEELKNSLMGQEQAIRGALSAEKIDEILRNAGEEYVDSKIGKLKFSGSEIVGGGAEERFREAGMRQVQKLRVDERLSFKSGGYGEFETVRTPTKDVARLQAADILERGIERQIEEARRLREEMQATRKLLEQQSQGQKEQTEILKDQAANSRTRVSGAAAAANLRTHTEPATA